MTSAVGQRPPRTYKTGKITTWIRRLSLTLTVLTAASVIAGYSSLPATIPTHFNFAGEADAWGSRSSVWLLVGIFGAMGVGLTWLSHYPRVFNYPCPITAENAQHLYRVGEQMLVWVSAACSLLFAGIVSSVFFDFYASVIIVPAGLGLFASTIVGLARMFKA